MIASPSAAPAINRPGSVARTAGRAPAAHESLAFGAALLAVAFSGLDGMRLGASVSIGDAFLVVTGLLLVFGLATRGAQLLVLPPWLLGAGALLMAAALLVELFPPSSISTTSLLSAQSSVYATARSGPVTSAYGVATTGGPSNLTAALRVAVTVALVPILVASVATSTRRLRRLTDAWIGGVALSSLVALVAALGLADLGPQLTGANYSLSIGSSYREAGLTAHPVLLSLSCSTAFPILLSRVATSRGPRRLGVAALAGLLVLGALVSGSRAGLVGIGGAVLLLPFMLPAVRRAALAIACGASVLIVLLLFAGPQFLPVLSRVTGGVASTAVGDTARLDAVRDGLSAFARSPVFGNGFQFARAAHNIYVQFLQGGGLIALAGFLLFAVAIVRIGLLLGRHPDLDAARRSVARGLSAAMLVFLGTGMLENPIQDRFLYVPAGLLLGLYVISLRELAAERVGGGNGAQPDPARSASRT